jgi:hypothetical protein
MGVERNKKAPSKQKTHTTTRLDKAKRIVIEKAQKRLAKKQNRKEKLDKEEELNPLEQDDEGFYKVPTEVSLL